MPEFAELLRGYRRFRSDIFPRQQAMMENLVTDGQHPKLMIISCSDSRVDPAHIFDVDPGEIFVLRNVAALVPPVHGWDDLDGVAAAVEFAVGFLKVRQIVVMGHSQCGGCKAALSDALEGTEPGSGAFIARWTQLLRDAREMVPARVEMSTEAAEREMEQQAVKRSLANLRTFPWVAQREESGDLTLRGTHFDIASGTLSHLDQHSGVFETVD